MVTSDATAKRNFYVFADDIHGPWSEPVYVEQNGIDPSLMEIMFILSATVRTNRETAGSRNVRSIPQQAGSVLPAGASGMGQAGDIWKRPICIISARGTIC